MTTVAVVLAAVAMATLTLVQLATSDNAVTQTGIETAINLR